MLPDESSHLARNPGDAPLEGDEGELEVGRPTDIRKAILETPLEHVKRAKAVTLPEDADVAKAIATMQRSKVGAVMVVSRKRPRRLVGILTERDLLARVLGKRGYGRIRLGKVMTPHPESLRPGDGLAYAINKMSAGGFRHVPIVDERGVPVGMLSAGDVLEFLVECVPEAVLNLPSDPKLALHPRADGD